MNSVVTITVRGCPYPVKHYGIAATSEPETEALTRYRFHRARAPHRDQAIPMPRIRAKAEVMP